MSDDFFLYATYVKEFPLDGPDTLIIRTTRHIVRMTEGLLYFHIFHDAVNIAGYLSSSE